jgi:hypothetical protein
MEQLVASLLLWLAANSAFDVATLKPPPVVLMSPEEMTILWTPTTTSRSRTKRPLKEYIKSSTRFFRLGR